MHPNVNKERKRREQRKLKKAAYRQSLALARAFEKMEAAKIIKPKISAKDWFRAKWNRLAKFIVRGHASINQAKNDIQKEIIVAAIAKRERKAIDIFGMRTGLGSRAISVH